MEQPTINRPASLSWFTPILYSEVDKDGDWTFTKHMEAKVKEYVEDFFYFGRVYAVPTEDKGSEFTTTKKSFFFSKSWKCLTYLAIASPILLTGGKKKDSLYYSCDSTLNVSW